MGSRDEIQTEIASAFSADDELLDAVNTFTCTRKVLVSSNPATGVDVYDEFIYSGRGVLFGSYSKDLVKPLDYQATDSKAVLLQNEVISSDGVQIEPKISDVWVIESKKFRVVNYSQDPFKSCWFCQLRKV